MNNNNYGLRIEYEEYVVQKGDSLYLIAKKYGTTVAELADTNMLSSNTIYPGQVLLVPKASNTDYSFENYVVKQDDTIEKIAEKTSVDPVTIGLYNDFIKLVLVPGQVLKIPRSNIYTIRNNDTVDSILSTTNRSAEQLLRANASTWLKTGSKIYL